MKLLAALTTIFLACGDLVSVRGGLQPMFAPTNAAGVEGNSFLLPLGGAGIITERFQQIYSSSLFSGFSEGVAINSFAIRPDGDLGNGFDTLVSIEISLSTTPKLVDGLSRVLDENVGADSRLIRSRDPFLISGGGGQGGPTAWVTLADVRNDPFYYNPAAGNLLVDMKFYYSTSRTTPFDAIYDPGDTVSTAYKYSLAPVQLDTRGLATLFVVSPVPEPGALSFITLGLVWAGVLGRKGILRKLKAYGAG